MSVEVSTICNKCSHEFTINSPDNFNIHPVSGRPGRRIFIPRTYTCRNCSHDNDISWMTEDEYVNHIRDITHQDIS
ncbi:MAG: hypothetical protein ACPKPY_06670 [Nitrososphaeraceae archaeon]